MSTIGLTAREEAELAHAKAAHINVTAVHCSRCRGFGHIGGNFANRMRPVSSTARETARQKTKALRRGPQ
jgi:hypothetical protein